MRELWTAILKGTGFLPTKYLWAWTPSFKNPFNFELVEVQRCETDGTAFGTKMPQSSRRLHGGHKFKQPKKYSLWELFLVQIREIK